MQNVRMSIKGIEIIIDYEFSLRYYYNKSELQEQGLVPVEMYPRHHDYIDGNIPIDEQFGVVKLEALYAWAFKQVQELERYELTDRLEYISNLFEQAACDDDQNTIEVDDDLEAYVYSTIKEAIKKLS